MASEGDVEGVCFDAQWLPIYYFGFMQSRGTLERLARFFSLLLFLFVLALAFMGRRCIFVARLSLCHAHAETVDEKSQRLDKMLKMFVQRDVLLDSTGLQSAMFLADLLARLLDLAIFSRSRTSAMFVCG